MTNRILNLRLINRTFNVYRWDEKFGDWKILFYNLESSQAVELVDKLRYRIDFTNDVGEEITTSTNRMMSPYCEKTYATAWGFVDDLNELSIYDNSILEAINE